MAEIYDINQIIGKTLFPRYTVDVYTRVPWQGGEKFATVKTGNSAGVVYSYVTDKATNTIWWQFQYTDGSFYYIEHKVGRFDVNALKKQGALTVDEKIEQDKEKEEQDNKPWYERLTDSLGKTATTIALGVGGFLIIRELIRNNK